MSKTTLSSSYLLTLVRHLEQVDLSTDIVEQVLGTDIVELENAAATGKRIPLALYSKFYRFYLQQMAGENFGFPGEVGDMTGRYRMLYTMMVNSKTLGAALDKLHQFYQTFAVNKQLIRLRSRNEQQLACELTIMMQAKYRNSIHQSIITANLAAGLHRVMCWLTGMSIPLECVEIAGDIPLRPESYEELFSCPVRFQQTNTALVLNSDVMQYGVVQTEASLAEFLHSFPEPLFINPEQQQLTLQQRVQALIGHKLHRDMPSLPQISDMLRLSTSALKRGLKAEDTSYHQMIETSRQQQAMQLLSHSDMALNIIAEQLGFPATSAFHRSFKRWTGYTPGDYRRKFSSRA